MSTAYKPTPEVQAHIEKLAAQWPALSDDVISRVSILFHAVQPQTN